MVVYFTKASKKDGHKEIEISVGRETASKVEIAILCNKIWKITLHCLCYNISDIVSRSAHNKEKGVTQGMDNKWTRIGQGSLEPF